MRTEGIVFLYTGINSSINARVSFCALQYALNDPERVSLILQFLHG